MGTDEPSFYRTRVDLQQLYRSDVYPQAVYGEQGWVETSIKALEAAVPSGLEKEHWTHYLTWEVPVGWHTLDMRLFELFRLNAARRGYKALAIECAGLENPTPQARRGELLRLDDLALAIERIWEVTWLDVPVARRPGLLLVRGDGAMPISADLQKVWPALKLISTVDAVTSADVVRVCQKANFPVSNTLASQVLGSLRRQGLLEEGDKDGRLVRHHCLSAHACHYLRKEVSRDSVNQDERLRQHGLGRAVRFFKAISEQQGYAELLWDQLYARLRDKGLRSIAPKLRVRRGRRKQEQDT